jgi:cell division protein FtsI/penicillin-binding protein 2
MEGSLYFVAFAPKDNQKITIAILVENGLWSNNRDLLPV